MAPEKNYDPNDVPVTFIQGADTATLRRELAELVSASAVAFDTETVYDGNDEITVTGPEGLEVTFKRNLDVDGPGSWRVLSIAARFGTGEQATFKAWVIDMKDADFATINLMVHGCRPYGWNANFDRSVLARDGVLVRYWYDAMLFDAVLRAGANGSDSSRYASLASVARRELGVVLDGKETTRLSYDADTELTAEQIRYAATDAIVTLWLGDLLGARARELGLAETVLRECAAQPLIQQMTLAGLPIDREAYLNEVINPARAAAEDAAERLAIMTTGRDLLTTVAKWLRHAHPDMSSEDASADGLAVLRSVELFGKFMADIRSAAEAAKAKVSVAAGGGIGAEDLFSDGPVVHVPFAIDDENDIRKWLSKAAPTFAGCVVAVSLNPELDLVKAEELAVNDPDGFAKACAGKKRLVKAHDLDGLVLPGLVSSTLAEVTDNLRTVARSLADYRRYMGILSTYGAAVAPVRLRPDWKVNAADSVKEILNTYAADQVKAHFKATTGTERLLVKSDSVDHDSLVLIGGDIANTLLEFRKSEKVLTTYGDEFLKFVHPVTGRIHARYNQAMTGTGRLSSHNPNAQNLPPAAKKYLRPKADGDVIRRVLVASDLSQAELRYVADQSADELMLGAFAAGEDLHMRTATLMFGVDLVALKKLDSVKLADIDPAAVEGFAAFYDRFCTGAEPKIDPSRTAASVVKELRQKAKKVAFGYAYGLKGASLANGLTVDGVPTTKEEADELLALFDSAYPAVSSWMGQRVAFVSGISSDILSAGELDVDFDASWKLHSTFAKVKVAAASAKTRLGYTPDPEEIAATLRSDEEFAQLVKDRNPGLSEDELAALVISERKVMVDQVRWALGFDYPVVLTKSGAPWMFSSRTAGGRVRWFPILTGDWEWGMVQSIVRSRDNAVIAVRDRWVKSYNERLAAEFEADKAAGKVRKAPVPVCLTTTDRRSGRQMGLFGKELEKQFEDRARRTDLVAFTMSELPAMSFKLMRAGMADRVRAMTNQFRNHPVQGGVADAMLIAMARIDEDLQAQFPSAVAIQSVHDSLVVECDVQDAAAVKELMVKHMQDGLNVFCPTVLALAEADVQLSLDDKTALDEQALADLVKAASRS